MDADGDFWSSSVNVLPGVVTERDEARLVQMPRLLLTEVGYSKSQCRFIVLFPIFYV